MARLGSSKFGYKRSTEIVSLHCLRKSLLNRLQSKNVVKLIPYYEVAPTLPAEVVEGTTCNHLTDPLHRKARISLQRRLHPPKRPSHKQALTW